MAFGTAGKRMMGPLLTANFVMHVIVLGLAGWSLDKYINGQNHPRSWLIALVSWGVTALAFGFACKQIGIGNRERRLRTLEAFIKILAITELIYLVVLHAGFVNSRYGTSYRSYEYVGLAHPPQKTTTPAA